MLRPALSLSCALLGGASLTACLNPGGTDLSTTGSGTSTGGDEASGTAAPTTGGSTTDEPIDEPASAVQWPTLDCDPLVPTYCGFPFPSNVFTTDGPEGGKTGRKLALGDALIPDGRKNMSGPPDIWNRADGFSPGLALMAHLPGATITGLPDPLHLEASLAADSPTIVLDAATGERVPHYAELDASTDDDTRRTFTDRKSVV